MITKKPTLLALAFSALITSSALKAGIVEIMDQPPTDNILACTNPNEEGPMGIDAEESPSHSRYSWGQTFTPTQNWEVDTIGIQFGGAAKALLEPSSTPRIKIILFEYDEKQFSEDRWGAFSNTLGGHGTIALNEEIFEFNAPKKRDWLAFNLAKKTILKKDQSYGFAIWISSGNSEAGDAWMILLGSKDTFSGGNLICVRSADADRTQGNTVNKRSDLNFFIQGKAL